MNGRARLRRLVAASVAVLIAAGSIAAYAGRLPDRFLVGGIQVNESDHGRWSDSLADVGLNTVAVTVYAKQGAWDSAHLWWEDDEPAVLDEIRVARSRGLDVVLILRVAVDHAFEENAFIWHGMIMPRSHDEIRAWFDRYRSFVLEWAAIAEREGVAILGIGSEMKALSATLPIGRWGNLKHHHGFAWYQRLQRKRARRFRDLIEPRHLWARGQTSYATLEEFVDARLARSLEWARQANLRPGPHTLRRVNRRRELINACWVDLIAATRGVYSGPLTYAANFDNFHNVGFWPQLDLIGINSYFSLRGNLAEAADPDSQPAWFADRWEAILDEIERFKRSQSIADKPFLFTELGYTFRRHSTVEPWNHGGFAVVGWKRNRAELVVWSEQPIDYGERSRAIDALWQIHRRRSSHLIGLLYWKLSTEREHESIEPFVVHVAPDAVDPAVRSLAAFATPPP